MLNCPCPGIDESIKKISGGFIKCSKISSAILFAKANLKSFFLSKVQIWKSKKNDRVWGEGWARKPELAGSVFVLVVLALSRAPLTAKRKALEIISTLTYHLMHRNIDLSASSQASLSSQKVGEMLLVKITEQSVEPCPWRISASWSAGLCRNFWERLRRVHSRDRAEQDQKTSRPFSRSREFPKN